MTRLLAGVAVGDPLPHGKAVAALGGTMGRRAGDDDLGHVEYSFAHTDGLVRVYSAAGPSAADEGRVVTCVTVQRTAPSHTADAVEAGYRDYLSRFTERYGEPHDVRHETVGVIEIVRHRWTFEGLSATVQFDTEASSPFYLLVKLETHPTGL